MNIEKAQELNNSSMWQEVQAELTTLMLAELSKLRTCKPEEVIKIQTRVDTIEFLKNLPTVIIERES